MADGKPVYYPDNGSGPIDPLTPREEAGPDPALRRVMPQLLAGGPQAKRPLDLRDPQNITDDELRALVAKRETKRDPRGRFVKGTPSPNPLGAPRKPKRRRMFGRGQFDEDVLQAFEQPVKVTRGSRVTSEPLIKALIGKLGHLALSGEMPALRKALDIHLAALRNRDQQLESLLQTAQEIAAHYAGGEMPASERQTVEALHAYVGEAQYRTGVSDIGDARRRGRRS